MAVTVPTSKPKTVFYKMVTVPKVKVTAQNAATVSSYKAFTTGMNRLGATLNSMVVVNKQFYDSMLSGLKLKVAEQDEERKRFEKEKQNKKKGSGLEKLASNFVKASILGMGDALKGIMMLFDSVVKLAISQALLRWISNPANTKKLTVLWNAITGFFKFLWDFVNTNIGKTLSGLADMLDSNKNFWERLQGFGTFIVGFGSLLIGFAFLRKPKLLISGVKFVLKTIWDSVSGLVKALRGRKTPRMSSGASRGASAASEAAGAAASRGGGRGRLLKGLAAGTTVFAPLIIGGMMGGGDSEFMKSVGAPSGGGSAPPDDLPHAAEGGIFTKPTRALIGERGPEARIPLTTPADNKQRMSRAGIKPLSGIKGDPKQAQKLSDLFMAPFRGIGAGILANVSQVVSGMGPTGQALTPILGNIITPIANSFGVPPSLVKTLTAKTQTGSKLQEQGRTGVKGKGDTSKIFGKGRLVTEDSKKFKKVGDTSVLGLLSNMVAAVQVIGNKAGGGNNAVTQTTQQQTSQSDPTNPETGSKITQTASGKAGTGRMSQVAGTSAGVGITDKDRNRQTGALEQNHIDFKDNGQDYSVLINPNNGEYKLFKKRAGLLWTDQEISIGGKDGPKKGGTNEKLLQKAHNEVQAFYVKNAPEKGLALKFIDQTMIDNYKKNKNKNKPKKANGGWITGPMSGYPVSLDGGGSTAFIGHGTEWVGFKRASGGSAFVIPFDTPATKNNPGLTDSRMRQAKQGGYAMPYDRGGRLKTDRLMGKDGKFLKSTAPGRAAGGIVQAAKKAVDEGKRGPASPPCASWVRMVLGMAGHPAAEQTTKTSDLDSEKGYNGRNFAGSFAGSDMGKVIRSQSQLEPGDIVLQQNTYGNFKPGSVTHVSIASDKKGKILHQPTSGAPPKEGSIFNFKAGVRLGGSGSTTPDGSSNTGGTGGTSGTGGSTLADMDPVQAMIKAFDAFAGGPRAVQSAGNEYGAKAFAPASQGGANIGAATTAVAFQKDLLKQNTLNTAAASVAGAKAATAQQKGQTPPAPPAAKPIIMPGPSRSLDIAHLNPRTSIIAYSVGGIL